MSFAADRSFWPLRPQGLLGHTPEITIRASGPAVDEVAANKRAISETGRAFACCLASPSPVPPYVDRVLASDIVRALDHQPVPTLRHQRLDDGRLACLAALHDSARRVRGLPGDL